MRDSQRQRVYDAETLYEKAGGSRGLSFRNKDEIQMYLFNLVQSPWYKKEFPKAPGTVHLRMNGPRVRSSASPVSGIIRIAKNEKHMSELVVLHELAHIASGPGAGHGREWCVNYLKLLRKKLGDETEEKLKECFKEKKVRFRPKRRVTTAAYTKGQTPPGFAALQKWREQQKLQKQAKQIAAFKKGLGLLA